MMSSAAGQKLPGEASPTLPTFSYAQAAKGRSPSVPPAPSSLSSGKASSESMGVAARRTSVTSSKDTTAVLVSGPAVEAVSEVREEGDLKDGDRSSDLDATPKTASSLIQSNSLAQSLLTTSTPSSPSFGTASTSTLPKEDELSSTVNGSSDSNWDKISQSSQSGSKPTEKVEESKGQPTIPSSNDEGPPSALLKEAPPPAVNIWQHRKEILDAKTKTKQTTGPRAPKLTTQFGTIGNESHIAKTPDNGVESKKLEGKKKVKSGSAYVEEKSSPGGNKEANKAGESRMRNLDEESSGYRGSRTPDTEKLASAIISPPPPPGDAISWPTPDSAKGEDRKRAQERAEKVEKEKTPATKPHGKEKWMPVPYVPSAVFSTPLPSTRRGGRTARGGRDGGSRAGTSQGNHSSEKAGGPSGGYISSATANANERSRDLGSYKNNTSSRPKRAASAGPSTAREQRKAGDIAQEEKPKEDIEPPYAARNSTSSQNEFRRASAATQTEDPKIRRASTNNQRGTEFERNPAKAAHHSVDREERYQEMTHEVYSHTRSTASDRRSDGSSRSPEYTRDFHNQMPTRDRGEGRGDRGRGIYRGRGPGNHGFPNSNQNNGQNFAHNHPNQHQPPLQHQIPKALSHHERHASQSHGSAYNTSQPVTRSFRSGSRSQSIPHPNPYGRFPNAANGVHAGPPLGPPQLPSLQTDLANTYGYQPGQQGIMSAIPYNSYMDQISLFGMVSMQMEYYFSVDNLCKDLFLRKQMDSQGFVFLSVLAKFNRIKQLTQEMELIRYVCLNSPNIEFRMGIDGIDRLRKREGWQQWVLNKEDRDPSAQNDGPPQEFLQARMPGNQTLEVSQSLEDGQAIAPHFTQAPQRLDDNSHPLPVEISPPAAAANTAKTNGINSAGPFASAPLSATVPDFAPAVPLLPSRSLPPTDSQSGGTSCFTDEQVDSLMIVVRKPGNSTTSSPPSFPSATHRTFSNGSIDSRTVHDEFIQPEERRSPPITNGDNGSEAIDLNRAQRPRSPFTLSSPARQVLGIPSPLYWVKDKETPIDSLPPDLTHESYPVFRRNALKHREQSSVGTCHRDMDILYQFWCHFLVRNFNTRMYEEFRRIAFEDAAKYESSAGMKNLIQYYDESILGQKIISDEIARDFVALVKSEKSVSERPAFDKLRTAWRNGAFNMKNRKKIDNIIDAELKAELES